MSGDYEEQMQTVRNQVKSSFRILAIIPAIFGLFFWFVAGAIGYIAVDIQFDHGFDWVISVAGLVLASIPLMIGNFLIGGGLLLGTKKRN